MMAVKCSIHTRPFKANTIIICHIAISKIASAKWFTDGVKFLYW